MQLTTKNFSPFKRRYPQQTVVKTTLYELVDAISDEVLPDEEKLVVEVVVNMFNTEKIKFTNNAKFV
jgi:DNA replication initiation complex subunit (GINS family)